MITVADLIKELQEMDPKTVIVMSSDSEGNSYSPFASFYDGLYVAESTWSGQVYTDADRDYCKEEGISLKGAKKCIVLCPTN